MACTFHHPNRACTGHGHGPHLALMVSSCNGALKLRFGAPPCTRLCRAARRHLLKCHAGAQQVAPVPPAGYASRWRPVVAEPTLAVIQSRYPQLLDLVKAGTLIAWPRPVDYVERREDGYQEPELVLIVGTAHVSAQSPVDVQRVIRASQPDAVVVELCRSRSAVMAEPASTPEPEPATATAGTLGDSVSGSTSSTDDPPGDVRSSRQQTAPNILSLTGGGSSPGDFLGAMQRSASLGGQSGLVLRLLLSWLARRSAGVLGVLAGEEFLAARRAAEAVGAQVVLGDRPVEITLQRAWTALTPLQRARLCWDLLLTVLNTSNKTLNADLVERLKSDDDALSNLLAALGQVYPELLGPLVHERDAYLAWSLKRSKAVNGSKVVVGVVGAGHLPGIVFALSTDKGGDCLRFSDLVRRMNSREVKRQQAVNAVGRFALELGLGTAAYATWLYWH